MGMRRMNANKEAKEIVIGGDSTERG